MLENRIIITNRPWSLMKPHYLGTTEFAPTLLQLEATIGANAMFSCGKTIGRYTNIDAGAVFIQDLAILPWCLVNRRAGWTGSTILAIGWAKLSSAYARAKFTARRPTAASNRHLRLIPPAAHK